MSLALPARAPSLAFGVDPTRPEKYSLRQARYQAVGEEFARLLAEKSGPLKFLDVGINDGVSMRYIEVQPGAERVEFHGVDILLRASIYNPAKWASLQISDLLDGLSNLPSNAYDVVCCEQVLEHLHDIATPIAGLHRVLKPGGTLIVGVPIFPPGLHLVRKHLVPIMDRVIPSGKVRGHVQAFCRSSFLKALQTHGQFDIQTTRGFRILSGGILRPLENHRWWWQLGRFTGRVAPGLCTEIQVIAVKR